ncbi:hypothetical protein ACUTAH_14325 [Metapseudomonas furukawaii]|uniref:hypothetical protein n=1 Tax=Metapseudomonas furukawaii TaxID=1149133 RepID=UPI004045E12F
MTLPTTELNFDPNWTADEAMRAGAEGPMSPFHRWAAWHMAIEYQAAFESGRKANLFNALQLCASHGLPMPEWVAKAYLKGFHRWNSYDAPSLDEAFDVKLPKGAHVGRLKKERKLRLAVPIKVRELQRQGRAIDESLFHDVGVALNVSGSTARNAYYKSPFRKLLHLQEME